MNWRNVSVLRIVIREMPKRALLVSARKVSPFRP